MAKLGYKNGVTSVVLRIKLLDTTSTTGAGKTGLVFGSAGLVVGVIADNEATTTAYTAAGSTVETITTLGTFAAPTSTKCRFKELDAVNHPGVYEVQIADARWAVSNARSVVVTVQATGAAAVDAEIQLTTTDPYDAVRGGLTALPNAAANATGGLAVGVVRGGTAQAGTSANITLDAGASATTNLYSGLTCYLVSGTGAGQARVVISYNGATKIASIDHGWYVAPASDSVFVLLPTEAAALNGSLAVTTGNARVTVHTGTARAGSASLNLVMDTGASATNNIYNSNIVTLTSGTGAGQTRSIVAYNGTTKIATVDKSWVITPDSTSAFDVLASTTPTTFSDQGVAQAGGASTVTLAATASATNSVYVGSFVTILAGTDAGETREITGYVGSTKVATVNAAWSVNPDTTSAYAVIPAADASAPSGVTAADLDAQLTAAHGAGAWTQPTLPTNFSALAITAGGAVTAGTVSDKTGYSLTQAFPSNFSALAITGGGAVTAGTVSDKTGYSLTQTFPSNFSALAITGGGAVTAGTVSDKTGYSLSQAFPSNFSSLAITGGGAVTADTVSAAVTVGGYASGQDPATLVLDVSAAGHNTAGTVGQKINSAGSAGDPLASAVPGAYGAGTAGFLLGTNLDAAVSTRSTYAGGDTGGTTTLLARLTSGRASNLDNLDAAVSTRSTYAGGAVASVTGDVAGNVLGSVASVAAGVTVGALAAGAITDAAIAVPAEAAGAPAGVLARLMWAAGRLGLRRVKKTAGVAGGTVATYLADGSTVWTTETYTTTATGDSTDDISGGV